MARGKAPRQERFIPLVDEHKTIVHDEWLSGVINRDVYRLMVNTDLIKKTNEKSSKEYKIIKELQSGRVFIYSKISCDDIQAAGFLERIGFNLVDTNIIFEKPIIDERRELTGYGKARLASAEDHADVLELARRGFSYSRFHMDSYFSNELADKIKAEWAGNYFTGKRGDSMLVGLVDGIIAGFLLLLYGKDDSLIIDLISVDEKYRRKGIAKDMILSVEAMFSRFTKLRVGTQLANIPSLAFYEGMGFRIKTAEYVFHYHGGSEDRGQRTEDRGQRTEDRGQRTEDRGQRTEDRGQRTEDRGQTPDI